MNINMVDIKQYINNLLPNSNNWEQKLEQYALENRVPIIEKDGIHFLTQLIKMNRPTNILELGTAIGYSALKMNEACPEAMITTLERNDEMVTIATENIVKLNKQDKINIIHGDALETIEQFQDSNQLFDFVFIDAAKGQYKRFFQLIEPLLTEDATIVCDNILFKGLAIDASLTEQKRLQKLAQKIDNFNKWLMENESYHTTIVPIGDGMAISMKNKETY